MIVLSDGRASPVNMRLTDSTEDVDVLHAFARMTFLQMRSCFLRKKSSVMTRRAWSQIGIVALIPLVLLSHILSICGLYVSWDFILNYVFTCRPTPEKLQLEFLHLTAAQTPKSTFKRVSSILWLMCTYHFSAVELHCSRKSKQGQPTFMNITLFSRKKWAKVKQGITCLLHMWLHAFASGAPLLPEEQ